MPRIRSPNNDGALRGVQVPTRSLILPCEGSHGGEAVALYNLTGRKAQEWQEMLLRDIMATNAQGLWTHVKFGYSVPRRNGKSEILVMRELWGLVQGEHIMHTAHLTTTSHSSWEKLQNMIEKIGLPFRSIRALGREVIELPDTGGRVMFRTRTAKGGLGEGVDLLIIDEAQEYQTEQENALKYIVTDSRNPQTLMCGTPPTPTSSGTVFTDLRNEALAGKTQDTGWAEWSVEEMSDVQDKALWAQANPSLGTIFNERDITAEIGPDKLDFNIQRLGLWVKYNLKSAISRADWAQLKTTAKDVKRNLKGQLFAGIKYGKDGENVALSIAVRLKDGRIFAEAIDCRPVRVGNAWILDFLSKADIRKTVVDGAQGQALLESEMKAEGLGRPIFPTTKEIIAANADFERGVFDVTLAHADQPSLTQVATNCEKRAIGSNGGFGYKAILEGAEIALLDSVILAYWACETTKEERKQQKVFY